jgi:hypothetical protein
MTPKQTMRTHVTMRSLSNGRRMWAAALGMCTRPKQGYAIVDWQVLDCETMELVGSVWQAAP